MKLSDFSQSKGHKIPVPQTVIQIGDGRQEKALQDRINALESALDISQTSAKSAILTSKQSKVSSDASASERRKAEARIETLEAVNTQLVIVADSVPELRGRLHISELATEKAERQAKINSAPRNMSQGAIESSTGFKMPGFGSIIPRKHLGGGQPNLVVYRVKEN